MGISRIYEMFLVPTSFNKNQVFDPSTLMLSILIRSCITVIIHKDFSFPPPKRNDWMFTEDHSVNSRKERLHVLHVNVLLSSGFFQNF